MLDEKRKIMFRDRREGGQELAEALSAYADRSDVVILGLPRGGVPGAFEVAKALNAPLDVFLVRKLGAPGHEELAMGAIASGDVRVLNDEVMEGLDLSQEDVEAVVEEEQEKLRRREEAYRGERPGVDLAEKVAILVDDGIATGATMRAAVKGLRQHDPAKIVVAVPVAPPQVYREFEDLADEVVCLETPQPFGGVGAWYGSFPQTSNEDVRDLLAQAAEIESG